MSEELRDVPLENVDDAEVVHQVPSAEDIKTPDEFLQEVLGRAQSGLYSTEQAEEINQAALAGEFDKVPEDLRAKAIELFSEPVEETPEETA